MRAELAKTGFTSARGVSAAEFESLDSIDGVEEKGVNRQKIAAIDAVLTEKRGRRIMKRYTEQASGLYAGPIAVLRFNRDWPPLIGDLLPYALWTSTRITELAVEERHEFPHASGGRLLARVTYEDRYADGELVQTERVRLRCDVEKLADAASIHASLGGKAALIRCQEEREPGGRSTGPKHPDTYSYEKVRYSHWYVLDSGWSIPLEGEWTLRVNEAAHARKWRSKLLSFEAGS